MRLIVNIHCTDDCTYSYTESYPVVYESPEAFLVDFESAAKKALIENKWPNFAFFELGGNQWEASDFFSGKKFLAPDIFTVDEWFANKD